MKSHAWIDTLEPLEFSKPFPLANIPLPQTHQKNAAVLIPILRLNSRWHVIFCHRSSTVENHKDQVSFPGGAMEPDDSSLIETALRESREEINLHAEDVDIVGVMPAFDTISSFRLTPVIGLLKHPVELKLSKEEVERVFTIPLVWLAAEKNYAFHPHHRENGTVSNVLFFKPYKKEVVWGITAIIMYEFVKQLKKQQS